MKPRRLAGVFTLGPAPYSRRNWLFGLRQLRASAEETPLFLRGVFTLQRRYRAFTMPIVILAGEGDPLVEPGQSARLHRELSQSTFKSVAATGARTNPRGPEQPRRGERDDCEFS